MSKHKDFATDIPRANETDLTYSKRLEQEGQREIYIRKALRAHFDMTIEEVIETCASLNRARGYELNVLRSRFSALTEARFAYKIAQTLTIPKDEARDWAKKIIAAEDKG